MMAQRALPSQRGLDSVDPVLRDFAGGNSSAMEWSLSATMLRQMVRGAEVKGDAGRASGTREHQA
jgi:hypothetical protein